tara:strand:+ start:7558 stop:8406 length:849 start_codon:yes stop_codon:yes gene_type:complete
MNIIGLGQAGCSIAEKFKQYSQYKIYKIDVGLKKGKNVHSLKHQETSELYESKLPNLKRAFLKEIEGDVLFITSCGAVSGASLRLLGQIKDHCQVTVLYIKPDINNLSRDGALHENLMFNVFQEYARSGVFKRLYIVDNIKIADIIGDIPVREYYNQINELIGSTIHMINVFDHSETVMKTFSDPIETARISTLGLVDYETGEEKMFFGLDMPREKRYYYAMPEEIIDSDGTLVKKIKKQVKNNIEHDKMKNSYAIYSTTYEKTYVYCIANSTLVQKNKKIA